MENLYELLEEAAHKVPTKGIVIVNNSQCDLFLTYSELREKSRKIAFILKSYYQVKPVSKIIISVEKSENFILLFWGCVMAGCIPVLMPSVQFSNKNSIAFERLKNAIDILGVVTLITNDINLFEYYKSSFHKAVCVEDIMKQLDLLQDYSLHIPKRDSKDLCVIQFSSGSTGAPKGVMLSFNNILTNLYFVIYKNELYRIACINMLVLPFSDIAVEIVEDSPFATSDNLFNEEKIFIKREWSEIRLKTYILGRCAAHRALQTLQKEIVPILKGRDGEPIWPFDIVGSISHKDAIAVAAVGKKKRYKGIGVDIEDQTTILSKKEYSLFCTPQEIACIDKKEFSPIDIFSRKEAILKAYYTAYSKLCNWIDIDTINVSKASNVTIICMLKKNFIINLCCVEK